MKGDELKIVGLEYLTQVMSRLSHLQINGKFCDVKIICNDGFLEAHSAVLASSCQAFGFIIKTSNVIIPMDQFNIKTVQVLLTFLYTGTITCEATDEIHNFVRLINELLPINLNHSTVNDGAEDILIAAKKTLELKLEVNAEGTIGPRKDESLTQSSDAIGTTFINDQRLGNVTKEDNESHQPYLDHTVESNSEPSDVIKNDNSEGLLPGESENKIDETREDLDNELLVNQSDEASRSSKDKKKITKNRGNRLVRKSQKSFRLKIESQKQSSKSEAKTGRKKRLQETIDSEEDMVMSVDPSDDRPDWTIHKGGDWDPDKYKKSLKEMKTNRPQSFLCGMCGHRAHDMRHHLNHLHCKHKIPYKEEDIGKWVDVCPYEGCSYAAALNMKSHIFHVHEANNGAFTCDTCKKVFKRQTSLRTHMRRVHIKPSDFKACPECGKMVSSHYLEKHISTVHNPDHYHLCSHCHFKTKSLSGARFHMITKHNDYSLGKVTIHECKYCDYKGTHIDNVQRHMTVHEVKMGIQTKKVLCDICGKAFSHQRLMESHRLWHTNKDRHKCQYCNFSAPFIRHVKLHTQRQHTQKEMRPWRCTHCAYCSNDRGNLKKHLLNTHKLPEPEVVDIMKASLSSSQFRQNMDSGLALPQ